MFKCVILLLSFPLFLCADINKEYSESFIQNLNSKNIHECHKILDDWEFCNPDIRSTIIGLKAVLVLVKGDIIKSISMMESALSALKSTTLSNEIIYTI